MYINKGVVSAMVLGLAFSISTTFSGYAGVNDLESGVASEEETWDFTWEEPTVPETTVPETTEPETTVPETTVPETTVPETTDPETTEPETTVPETTKPATTKPATTVPETTRSSKKERDEDPNNGPGVFKIVEMIPETIVEAIPETYPASPIPRTGDNTSMFGILKIVGGVLILTGAVFAIGANRRTK